MKATGIVRHVDNLGRIVIPKEIRRTLKIREGDPLSDKNDTKGQILYGDIKFCRLNIVKQIGGFPVFSLIVVV